MITSEIQIPLTDWIGRSETRDDRVTHFPIAALSATLDLASQSPKDGDILPPLWHWLYFLPLHRQSDLGLDGHARRGGFLPPVPLPRRMWAGGRFNFIKPLAVGQNIRRVSTIANVTEKTGRTGRLVFVLVRHEVFSGDNLALTEEHDIVYRDLPREGDPLPPPASPPAGSDWSQTIAPDDVLLFRYSALTFNGHRIHYDRRYVTQEEGYPGLIVHGPLIATLLAKLACDCRPDQVMSNFSFRAVSPVFDTSPFKIFAKQGDDTPGDLTLWAETANGHLAMEAKAHLEPAGSSQT